MKKIGEKLLRICLMIALVVLAELAASTESYAAMHDPINCTSGEVTDYNAGQSSGTRSLVLFEASNTNACVNIIQGCAAVTADSNWRFCNNGANGTLKLRYGGTRLTNFTLDGGNLPVDTNNVIAPGAHTITYTDSTDGENRTLAITVNADGQRIDALSSVTSTNPEINVKGFSGSTSTDIDNGDMSPNGGDGTLFTNAPLANFGSHTQNYRIENLGAGALTLGASAANAVTLSGSSDFTVEQQPATSVASNANTTFKIKFTPTSTTQQNATVSIANNDSNEAPYTFAIQAVGTFRPTLTKTFSPSTIIAGGTSTIIYTITDPALIFSGVQIDVLPAGLVIASPPNTTTTCSNGNINSPSAGSATISFNISLDGSCALTIDVTASTTGVFLDPIASTSSSIADISGATDTLTVVAAAPQIEVTGNSNTITDGQTTISGNDFTLFNDVPFVSAGSDTETYVIENTGTSTLTLGIDAVSVTGSDFSVVDQPKLTLAPGETDSFRIAFSPSSSGTQTATVSVAHNATGAPFTFNVEAAGAIRPTLTKSFSPATIAPGEVSTITYTINNPDSVFHGDITDILPVGLAITADSPTPCSTIGPIGYNLNAPSGGSTITINSPNSFTSCSFTAKVTSNTPGTYVDAVDSAADAIFDLSGVTDTLTVTSLILPTFAKQFSPDTINVDGISTVTYTIDNSASAVAATNLSFTDNFHPPIVVDAIPDPLHTCNGNLTANAGAGSASYSGGSVAAGESCTIHYKVTANATGSYSNPTSDLTSSNGNSGTANDRLEVINTPLQISAEFENFVTYREKSQVLTLTLENTTSTAATNVVMTFNLPAGMRKLEASIDSNANCSGGTFTGGAGATSFSYGNGTIPANSTCVISFEVIASTTGPKTLSTGAITSNLGVTTAASAQTNIAPLPTHTISYSPATIAVGQVSTLTFSITTYDEDSGILNDVAVGMELPAGLKVAPTENVGGTCSSQGDNLAANRLSFYLFGSTSPQPTCTHSIDVIGELGGSYTTPSRAMLFESDITDGTTTPSASATLTVTGGGPGTGEITIIQKIVGADASVSFTSATNTLSFALTTVNGHGQILVPNVAEGMHEITAADLTAHGYGLESIMCSDADSTGDVSTRTATINLASNEEVTCTFSMIETSEVTSKQIADYMGARNTLLLSHQPERNRRLEKLKSAIGDGENSAGEIGYISGSISSFAGIPTTGLKLNGNSPLPFNAAISDDTFSFNTSLREIISSGKGSSYAASNYINNSKWDIWSEGHFARFDDDSSKGGRFGVFYGGIEYLVKPNLLVGVMGQYDWLEQKIDNDGAKTSGTGWMIGPYSTLKLDENLYFDIRGAWGRSSNTVNPFGTYSDTFDTERWLISTALIGEFNLDNLTVKPTISLQYIEDRQSAYKDSLNVTIPQQTISQGDLRFGPRFSYNQNLGDGIKFTPWAQIEGVYTFGDEGAYSKGSLASQTNGITAKLQGGFDIASKNGIRFNVSGDLSGLGSTANSYGASVKLIIPIK